MKNLILPIIVFLSFKCVAQVTSVTGTTNQINTSALTGSVTLSLPQSIATISIPQFARLAIGNIQNPSIGIYNRFNITGSTTAYGNLTSSVIQSDVTTTAYGYRTTLSTAATAFNLSSLVHYSAGQNALGVNSTIGSQIGFYVEASLGGAGNNFGFRGSLGAATGRWNLYMDGTAANYLAGNLGIGTTNPTEKLSVNGNIRAKEVRVEASPWPDYVFHENYSLSPLSEVEKFIQVNQHLPGIPSASEVEKEGLNLGEMNAKLLQKIEELTLYMIELKKENIVQTKEIELLKAKLK